MAEEKSMRLVGSEFTKIGVERNPEFKGKLSVNSDIGLVLIEKFKPESAKQETLKIVFKYSIDYAELGNVTIEGRLYILADTKTQKEILKGWKDKKMDTPEHLTIMNMIMQRSTIKALELEEELGLPIHIKLPVLQSKQD
jgi:hypothetical protein